MYCVKGDIIMGRIKAFASRQPLLFVILLILSALVIANLAAILAVILLNIDQTDPLLSPVALLTATLFLAFILWRFRWLDASGVASLGSWKGWGVALLLLIYYLFELIYSFFGEFSFNVPAEAVGGLSLPSVFISGMFEEILFRGAVLYSLMSVWGATRRGILKAAVISAILFGLIHALNAISGDASEIVGQMTIALLEGIWWAAIVLNWGSVWPVVFIHGITNWVLRTKSLGYTDYYGTASSYLLAIFLGLPLAGLGVWWILRGNLATHPEGASSLEYP